MMLQPSTTPKSLRAQGARPKAQYFTVVLHWPQKLVVQRSCNTIPSIRHTGIYGLLFMQAGLLTLAEVMKGLCALFRDYNCKLGENLMPFVALAKKSITLGMQAMQGFGIIHRGVKPDNTVLFDDLGSGEVVCWQMSYKKVSG